jgi:hypothetical protein
MASDWIGAAALSTEAIDRFGSAGRDQFRKSLEVIRILEDFPAEKYCSGRVRNRMQKTCSFVYPTFIDDHGYLDFGRLSSGY